MKKAKLKSPAKINLTLEVIRRLPDGYHELRSVMMKISNLYDEIEVVFDEKKQGIKIICDDKNVPVNEKNIVCKIAEKFFKNTGKRVGLEIKIKKNIPMAAGLGGGSSNGASVLLALNDYFGKPLGFKKLIELAAETGKDIPFFLQKEELARVGGAGEKIKGIKNKFQGRILIIGIKGDISTPWAYGELDKELFFMSDKKRINLTDCFIKNIDDLEKSKLFIYNDFEIVAKKKYPIIESLEKALLSFGAIAASLTGKGPTIFGVFRTGKEALEAGKIMKKYYPDLILPRA